MSNINLDFRSFVSQFDHAPSVESSLAVTSEPHAAAFLVHLGAKPFGDATVHRKADNAAHVNTEKVQAFSEKHYLYVCRTINGITKVFKYFAPGGLLLVEACHIVEEHHKMSTLHLLD